MRMVTANERLDRQVYLWPIALCISSLGLGQTSAGQGSRSALDERRVESEGGQASHQHTQVTIQEVRPEFPEREGKDKLLPGPVYTIEQLEQIALARNPTLAQAARRIEEARALRLQSGLYPNPVVGYTGEEVRGGSYRGGQQGFFLEQPVVLGGKLALNRKIGDQEIQLSVAQAEAQHYRVLNSVRMLFYRSWPLNRCSS